MKYLRYQGHSTLPFQRHSRVIVAHVASVVPGQVVGTLEVERYELVALVEAVAVVRVREEAVLGAALEGRMLGGGRRRRSCRTIHKEGEKASIRDETSGTFRNKAYGRSLVHKHMP